MTSPNITSLLFDLDGTLVDSLRDIAESMNAILARWSCPTHPVEAYNTFVGDGMMILAERVLPKDIRNRPEKLSACVAEMRIEYAGRWRRNSRPYPGITDLLTLCASHGIRMGILSNKPEPFTKEMVSHFFPQVPFATVRGAREGVPVKPDPTAAIEIQQAWESSASAIAYVGDTDTDMKTGRAAGFYTVGVSWGFRTRDELSAQGADCIIDTPSELVSILNIR